MRWGLGVALIIAMCCSARTARADIPTGDAAQLTQHAMTASTTVKLVPVATGRQTAHGGVRCAVTTGRKASVTDPTVQPQVGAGAQAIQAYAPSMPATPQAGAQGAVLSSQTLFQSSGAVVAGLEASHSSLGAALSAFQTASQQVGSAPTVMGAVDMNSASRLQNVLAWNGAIGSANLWVTALNALNLALASDTSRAALAMKTSSATTAAPQSPDAAPVCPLRTVGSGTAADPCRAASSCSPASAGTPTDPACVTRYVETDGNLLFVLPGIPSVNSPTPAAPSPPASSGSVLTPADVAAALNTLQSTAR